MEFASVTEAVNWIHGESGARRKGEKHALDNMRALLRRLGVPPETSLLMLLRPLSGSAAMAISTELMQRYGADSLIGRTAAVMIGSSETTFYVLAVYGAAAGIRRTRWIIPAALCADLVCFLSSAWICRLLWT